MKDTLIQFLLCKNKADIDEPTHSLGWHDGVKEDMKPREEFKSDEDYQEYCEACAI